ncbi:hypothetical protein [Microbacterium sp. NPDC089188]|uniref:hypothetical protein n=1 Tax=Microbacterium sp. NPDC089188 TaxID=3154971 RepID=UPI003416992F
MRTADIISDTIPHGTPDGHRAGCRTSACPAALPCRDVYRRYAGDYSFRRLFDAGVPLADIVAADDAAREDVAKRDRAANRAARKRVAQIPAPAPKRPRRAEPAPAPLEPAEPIAPALTVTPTDIERAAAVWRVQKLALDLALRNAERAVGEAIAARDRAFDEHVATGEPTAPAEGPRNGRRRRRDEIKAGVRALHAAGKSDAAMGVALKATRAYVSMVRRDLGLASNVPAGGQKVVA